jgi:Ca2+-binding RTX toxin-like protein
MTQYISTAETNTVTVDTDIDQEIVVTASGSITSNNGSGIDLSGISAAFATIFGAVYANDTGINFAHDFSTVAVAASGTVYGTFAGVNLGGNDSILRNDGQIQAADFGIINAGVLLGGTDNYVFNTGSISGVYGIRAEFEGYRNQIVNRGVISGSKTAISLNLFNGLTGSGIGTSAIDPSRYGVFNHGDILGGSIGIEGTGPVRVVNTGLIDAADLGVSLTTGAGEQSILTNSGTIVAAVAFRGGGGQDTVLNTGQIEGDLTFGDDADLYDGRGGRVFGIVALGDGNDTAHGGDDVDVFRGGFDDDNLFGHGGDDVLDAGAGNDRLDGGTGLDRMTGGQGDDTYIVDHAGDEVVEVADEGIDTVVASISYALGADVEDLVLAGEASLNGTGNELSNAITGNDGDNILDGRAGADILSGGKGSDTYIVDHADDLIREFGDQGTDTVRASVSHVLSEDVEHLILTGVGDLDGTGNELANTLTGNAGNNVLDGRAGADRLAGGSGDDTYIVDHEGDRVLEAGGEGSDTVTTSVSFTLGDHLEHLVLTGFGSIDGTGNGLANTVMGNEVDNILDGGAGADLLRGGHGNDTYIVDDTGDAVDETGSSGLDTVRASVSYALTANVEKLVLTGEASLNGTGNELSNIITGNDSDNILDGGASFDELRGGKGNDTYIVADFDAITENEGEGTDTIKASLSFALTSHVENLVLTGSNDLDGTGNELANTITGNVGNNVLNGGVGADLLRGGDGDDTYIVDNAGDIVIEEESEGADTVESSVSFTLGANLEHLLLTSFHNISGTGNALANIISGNFGNNLLDGGAGSDELDGGNGNDTLNGGEGTDALTGGVGDDTFIVDNAGDIVGEDENAGTDTVRASVDFTLVANVENLVLAGGADLSGTGNDLGNTLTGNTGSNSLSGGLGDDLLDGGLGRDTALFSGNRAHYQIVRNQDGTVTVTDLVGEDGVDVLRNMEVLQFSDGTFSLTNKAPSAPVVQGPVNPVNENAPAHSVVATVRASDAEDDALTYSLTANPGNKFAIDPTTGVITLVGAVNYEATGAQDPDLQAENAGTPLERKFYNLVVRATETASGISSGETTVKVYVNNVNEAPTDLSFGDGTRAATIREDAADGLVVGNLIALDPDGDTDLVFAFDTSGRGGSSGAGNAGGRFKIEDGKLKVAALTDITRPETYTVTIKVTDKNGDEGSTSTYRDFLIRVNPTTGAPVPELSIMPPTVAQVNEGDSGYTDMVFTVTRTNPEGAAESRVKWTIAGTGIDAEDFEALSGWVVFNGNEMEKTITARVRGDTAAEASESFTVTLSEPNGATISTTNGAAGGRIVNDDATPPPPPNQAPSVPTLEGRTVAELVGVGTRVGTLASTADPGETLTYTLLDDAGGRFKIVGDQLQVANGFKLDHEQAGSHIVKVRVSDGTHTREADFVIDVTDVNPDDTAGSPDHDVFKGGVLADRMSGNLGNDRLFGGGGADTLRGEAGHDVLGGGAGRDKLYGLKGAASRDAFLFDTKLTSKGVANQHKDQILDFGPKFDAIWFDDAAFTNRTIAKYLKGKMFSLDAPMKMKAGFFKVGTKATDKDDFFIYNARTKKLYWDVDGSGKKAMVEIATIKLQKGEGTTLTHKDFFFV